MTFQFNPNSHVVPYVEQQYWAEIAYYEYNQRVGEKFLCGPNVITVDGYTDPNESDRFCLGKLNNLHRSEVIDKTRHHIGKGIRLTYVDNKLFLDNIMSMPENSDPNQTSGPSVFVQSSNYNMRERRHPNTVVKLLPGRSLVIFDNNLFREVLDTCAKSGFETTYRLTTTTCNIR